MRILFLILLLSACNTVNIKPGTMEKDQVVYADRGGYSMKSVIKEELEKRRYKVVVGKSSGSVENSNIDLSFNNTMDAKYIVKVQEEKPSFSPITCLFGGFYWWKFNVSIANQKTGEELLSWSGRGCANFSIRKLNHLLDELEQK